MRLDVLPDAPVDVLIADDDAQLRGSVRLLLEAQGFTCAEAADGRQAVTIARALAPRCVFVDLAMPGLDGLIVTRRLRQDPRTAHVRVHCLTGHADPASRRQAEEAGCDLFLAKPVNPNVIVAAVRGWSGLTKSVADELLDWLEAHGYAPAEVTHEAGVGFTVRVPGLSHTAAEPGEDAAAIGTATLPPRALRRAARSVQWPIAGERLRYVGRYRRDGAVGHIAVRVTRAPALLACAVVALGVLAAYGLGLLSLLNAGLMVALLALVLAIPCEERWLPFTRPDCGHERDDDGGLLEFEGIVSARGRFGLHGLMHRRVVVLHVVRYQPRRAAPA